MLIMLDFSSKELTVILAVQVPSQSQILIIELTNLAANFNTVLLFRIFFFFNCLASFTMQGPHFQSICPFGSFFNVINF